MSAEEPAEALAWAQHSLAQERPRARLFALLVAVLLPLWSLFDFALEPSLAWRFLGLRVAGASLAVGLGLLAERAAGLGWVRLCTAGSALSAAAPIAVMLAVVPRQHTLYLAGALLVPFGCGVVPLWTGRWAAGTGAAALLAHASAHALLDGPRAPAEALGEGFFVVTAWIVAAGAVVVRGRASRRIFLAGRALEARNRELDAALASLRAAQARLVESEKLSALGWLLAGVSHEINNPVNVIQNNLPPLRAYAEALLGALDLVAADLDRAPEPLRRLWEAREVDHARGDLLPALDAIGLATTRLAAVHSDLRAYVRGDASEPVVGDLAEGLRATVAMVRRGLPPGVVLEEAIEPLPAVRLRPGAMNQVFLNLLRNAIDAVDREGTVAVRARALQAQVEVSFEDSGPGVSPAVRARLFEPFFTTKGEGTGLGLATSYRIVSEHGGALTCDPHPARGARFVVTLPAAAGARGASAAPVRGA
ncbi:MAG: hypothetical protein HY909_01315 [Deltaproteobacteria bacterium]|nr:hypothetical protein [Deltaproteobacteria bacterium]